MKQWSRCALAEITAWVYEWKTANPTYTIQRMELQSSYSGLRKDRTICDDLEEETLNEALLTLKEWFNDGRSGLRLDVIVDAEEVAPARSTAAGSRSRVAATTLQVGQL